MRLDWKSTALVGELVFVILFFSFAVVTHSAFFEKYQSDVAYKEKYCNAKEYFVTEEYKKDCEGFLYRAVSDPIAMFTAGLFVFTIALALATSVLIFVTLYGILQQGRSTERLFAVDQRPWIRVYIKVDDEKMFSFHQNSIYVHMTITAENIWQNSSR